jgi:hypothetical protein
MGCPELMQENLLGKLIVGAGSPFLGIVVSLSVINEYLQTVSLLVGIAVGVGTFVSMVRKWRR